MSRNPIEDNRRQLIGSPIDRVDGALKVTGRATYAYEYAGHGKAAYGYIVGATIAKGTVTDIDASEAEAAPGVLKVFTHRNMPALADFGPPVVPSRFERAKPSLTSNEIRFYGEPIAYVVADSFEAARHAAHLVKATYRRENGKFTVGANLDSAYRPDKINAGMETDTAVGDFHTAYEQAPVSIDSTYTTPYQHHNAMEPQSSMAVWNEDGLTLYTSTQLAMSCRNAVANTLQIPKDKVRVICKYIGGGFGAKLPTEADAILTAVAARELRRPVKTALTRQQTFANSTHRTESIQRIRLAASRDGKLTAIGHEVWEQTSTFEQFAEQAAACSRSLYAAPNRLTSHRIVRLDLPQPDTMRAPGEAIGLLTSECAMDELAHELGIDPIELRVRNEPSVDPERQVPFSSRHLAECMREGARRFGWEQRPSKPATRREGQLLIGYGMAAAIRPNYLVRSRAKVRVEATGRIIAKLAMTDIGTGSYTILTQIAAEALGVPMEQVTVHIGDSSYPPTPGSGGSFGAASSGSGLYNACMELRRVLADAATKDPRSPLHGRSGAPQWIDGQVIVDGVCDPYSAIASRSADGYLEAQGEIVPGDEYQKFSQHAFGAHFAEVTVDADTGEVRLRRMLGVFAAGRILNAKTARSQLIGGMIWGVGSALHEESIVDERDGSFVNHDLAGYHVAANADAPDVDAVCLDEFDDKGNPLGIKGIGELGICGAGAAVANAVFNATGVRVRSFPITLDKLLPHLPV